METIKTALVVVLLLAVLFGAYTVLNRPDPQPPKEIAWLEKSGPDALNLDIGAGDDSKKSSSLQPPEPSSKGFGTIGGNEKPPAFMPSPATDPQPTSPTMDRLNLDSRPALPLNDASRNSPVVPLPDLTSSSPPTPNVGLRRDFNLGSSNDKPGVILPAVPDGENGPNNSFTAPKVVENPFFKNASTSPDPSGATPNLPARNASGGSSYAKLATFDQAYKSAQAMFAENRWRDALSTLSAAYLDPNLTTAEREKLLSWLDPLAGKVVYSAEHLVENAHVVQRGETLPSIANQYNVPWQLLQNINNVRNPEFLIPGTRLKVVRGPFRAEVDLVGKELTMYVQEMYAGRFPISVGFDPAPAPGDFEVKAKEPGRTFFSRDGRNLPPTDPSNPYGRCWLDLGRELCIHGSSSADTGTAAQGCISLSPRDADDVFGILSQGSKVSIRR